jgi:hypothetical protein
MIKDKRRLCYKPSSHRRGGGCAGQKGEEEGIKLLASTRAEIKRKRTLI